MLHVVDGLEVSIRGEKPPGLLHAAGLQAGLQEGGGVRVQRIGVEDDRSLLFGALFGLERFCLALSHRGRGGLNAT